MRFKKHDIAIVSVGNNSYESLISKLQKSIEKYYNNVYFLYLMIFLR